LRDNISEKLAHKTNFEKKNIILSKELEY